MLLVLNESPISTVFPIVRFPGHCRFLVPGNTQKILTDIWHHFWLKMMVKSALEKIILKLHGGLQRYLLTCQANSAFLGRFFCTGQQQQLWRPSWNLKVIFSRPLFTIILSQKWSQISARIFCVLSGTRNLQWEALSTCFVVF